MIDGSCRMGAGPMCCVLPGVCVRCGKHGPLQTCLHGFVHVTCAYMGLSCLHGWLQAASTSAGIRMTVGDDQLERYVIEFYSKTVK